MSDDIVTRLRAAHGKVLPDFYCNNLRFDACYEIERLRALVSELAEVMMPFALLMSAEEQQKVLKAVRGEE